MKKILTNILLSIILCFNAALTLAQQGYEVPAKEELNAILEDFDAYAQKTHKQWNVPGMAVCIIVGDEIVYKKAYGVKKLNTEDPVDTGSVFQIASCTKAFTSALIAMLVDLRYLDWDDKVIEYLPDFRLFDDDVSENMTIEDLLAQNSGLPPYSQHLMMLFEYDKKHIIESMRYIKPIGEFRGKYSYQNNLYLVLGEIVKKATGKSWEKNIENLIFKPLNMRNSSTDYKGYLKAKNRTIGHYYAGGKLTPISDELSYNSWPYTFAPASGINSSIDDMAKWLMFIINDATTAGYTLISPENYNKLFEPRVFINNNKYDKSKKNYYCLGWRCSESAPESVYWHAGTTDGEGAYVSFLKKNKIGMVVLMNLPNGKMADALSKRFFDAYLKKPQTDWSKIKLNEADTARKNKNTRFPPEIKAPHLELKKYTGEYHNHLYGNVEIKLEADTLYFSAGAKKTWIKLKHFNSHSFDGTGIPGWKFKRPMFIFRVYEESNVNGLVVENMTDGVERIFRKVR